MFRGRRAGRPRLAHRHCDDSAHGKACLGRCRAFQAAGRDVGQAYVAALLAIAGGVLIVALFAALVQLVPAGRPGSGLLRVALAGCIITQTLVAVGGIATLLAVNVASIGLNPDLVSFCWGALWISFVASGVPKLLFTITGVLGIARAGLAASCVTGLGWISAAAHTLVLFAIGEQGLFALDGPIGMLTPVTTDIWILTVCATLSRRMRQRG